MSSLLTVRMTRPNSGVVWGFRLYGGAEFRMPLVVPKIMTNSVAERAGLRVNDIVIAVNSCNAETMTHEQAKMEIIRTGNDLTFVVRRSDTDEPFQMPAPREMPNYPCKYVNPTPPQPEIPVNIVSRQRPEPPQKAPSPQPYNNQPWQQNRSFQLNPPHIRKPEEPLPPPAPRYRRRQPVKQPQFYMPQPISWGDLSPDAKPRLESQILDMQTKVPRPRSMIEIDYQQTTYAQPPSPAHNPYPTILPIQQKLKESGPIRHVEAPKTPVSDLADGNILTKSQPPVQTNGPVTRPDVPAAQPQNVDKQPPPTKRRVRKRADQQQNQQPEQQSSAPQQPAVMVAPSPTVSAPPTAVAAPSPTVPAPAATTVVAPSPTVSVPAAPTVVAPSPTVSVPAAPTVVAPSPTVSAPAAPTVVEPSPTVSVPDAPTVVAPSPTVSAPPVPDKTKEREQQETKTESKQSTEASETKSSTQTETKSEVSKEKAANAPSKVEEESKPKPSSENDAPVVEEDSIVPEAKSNKEEKKASTETKTSGSEKLPVDTWVFDEKSASNSKDTGRKESLDDGSAIAEENIVPEAKKKEELKAETKASETGKGTSETQEEKNISDKTASGDAKKSETIKQNETKNEEDVKKVEDDSKNTEKGSAEKEKKSEENQKEGKTVQKSSEGTEDNKNKKEETKEMKQDSKSEENKS